MKKLLIFIICILASQAFASVRVLTDEGLLRFYKMNDGFVEAFSCEPREQINIASDEQVLDLCSQDRHARYTHDFFALINEAENNYYNTEDILSSVDLVNFQKQMDFLIAIDRSSLLNLEQEFQLEHLGLKIENHYKALSGKEAFRKAFKSIIELMSSPEIEYISSSDLEYLGLFDLSFSEKDMRCGEKGSLEERIQDCSIHTLSSVDGFVRVLKSNEYTEVYRDTQSGNFWGKYLESAEDFKEFINRPWRWTLEVELTKLPISLQGKLFQTTSLALLGIENFSAEAKSDRGGKISLSFESGMLYFKLDKNGKTSDLKELNLSEKPLKVAKNNLPLKKGRFQYISKLWETQIGMNDYLMEKMKISYFILFPVPVIAHSGYSLAYVPGSLVDLFGKKSRAYRNIKKMLKGENVEVPEKVFVEMETAIKEMHF